MKLFRKPAWCTILTTKEWRKFGGVESRSRYEKLRRYKSNWLRQVTAMNSNRMAKIMLNYRPNGRRRLGRLLKGLLDWAGTDLSRHNSWWMMIRWFAVLSQNLSFIQERTRISAVLHTALLQNFPSWLMGRKLCQGELCARTPAVIHITHICVHML